MQSDIEIAQQAEIKPITEIAAKLDIPSDQLVPYGAYKAKVSLDFYQKVKNRPQGKLVLVTGLTPTAAGEGKSTVTVGLGDGLRKLGKKSVICLREPSLGPCFGVKGGAAGGGYSQVIPMEDINLHFTGDIHAVSTAHNLLSAMLDNHIQQGNALAFDLRRIQWRRVLDMNDRALRDIVVGMGGTANGVPRETGFDISVASEVMAVLCLSENLADLKERLGNIVIGETRAGKELIRARDLNAHGAMAVLLKDALAPNLVQTLEGTPAFVHGGPFANIAHGCNSVVATKMALGLGEYTITEAGFGADLGAEKFFDIKCRKAGLKPDAVVIVATIRAVKLHGGVGKNDLSTENVDAVEKGAANILQHLENLARFGVPAIVAMNHFVTDTDAEVEALRKKITGAGTEMVVSHGWAKGGDGTTDLAELVVKIVEAGKADFQPLYPDDMPLWDKLETVAKQIYRADGLQAEPAVRRRFEKLQEQGFGNLPVCVAKTQYSFSPNAALLGAPRGFNVQVREVRLSAGAGFIVVLTGDIMTLPGLPRKPAAESIDLDENGKVVGLF